MGHGMIWRRSPSTGLSGEVGMQSGGGGTCFNLLQLYCCPDWMEVIEIDASPHDLLKLRESVAPFRPPSLVRCQVAGDDVWTWVHGRPGWSPHRAEVLAPSQVSSRVGFLRLLEVRVSDCGVIEVWRPAAGVVHPLLQTAQVHAARSHRQKTAVSTPDIALRVPPPAHAASRIPRDFSCSPYRRRRRAPAASRKSCSVCRRPRKNRIVGSWRTGRQSTQRSGAASINSTAEQESPKINWMLT
jgi:hypothetical protein